MTSVDTDQCMDSESQSECLLGISDIKMEDDDCIHQSETEFIEENVKEEHYSDSEDGSIPPPDRRGAQTVVLVPKSLLTQGYREPEEAPHWESHNGVIEIRAADVMKMEDHMISAFCNHNHEDDPLNVMCKSEDVAECDGEEQFIQEEESAVPVVSTKTDNARTGSGPRKPVKLTIVHSGRHTSRSTPASVKRGKRCLTRKSSENERKMNKRKIELQIEYLKLHKYKMTLKMLQLERELQEAQNKLNEI